jgi:hypothetical protein
MRSVRPALISLGLFLAAAACGGGSGSSPDATPTPADPDAASAAAPDADLGPPCDDSLPYPDQLSCTGLYADWGAKVVAPDVRPFAPGLVLWSDGAVKSRWIRLPPGTTIDASDPNEWNFPIGTRFWKEFKVEIGGVLRRVETRMWWKRGEADWVPVVYAWNADETEASELTGGMVGVGGTTYEIPAETACIRCHGGRHDNILGFESIALAAPAADGTTLASLQQDGLLTGAGASIEPSALQVPGDAAESRAIGWLHMNCGVCCHNNNVTGTRFQMRLEVAGGAAPATVQDTAVFKTAINQTSLFTPAGQEDVSWYRLRPTDPSRSELLYRIGVRDDGVTVVDQQMPPILSHQVDDDDVAAVTEWVQDSMTVANGYPSPAP